MGICHSSGNTEDPSKLSTPDTNTEDPSKLSTPDDGYCIKIADVKNHYFTNEGVIKQINKNVSNIQKILYDKDDQKIEIDVNNIRQLDEGTSTELNTLYKFLEKKLVKISKDYINPSITFISNNSINKHVYLHINSYNNDTNHEIILEKESEKECLEFIFYHVYEVQIQLYHRFMKIVFPDRTHSIIINSPHIIITDTTRTCLISENFYNLLCKYINKTLVDQTDFLNSVQTFEAELLDLASHIIIEQINRINRFDIKMSLALVSSFNSLETYNNNKCKIYKYTKRDLENEDYENSIEIQTFVEKSNQSDQYIKTEVPDIKTELQLSKFGPLPPINQTQINRVNSSGGNNKPKKYIPTSEYIIWPKKKSKYLIEYSSKKRKIWINSVKTNKKQIKHVKVRGNDGIYKYFPIS